MKPESLRQFALRAKAALLVPFALAHSSFAAISSADLPLQMQAGDGLIGSPSGGAFWSTYWVDAKWPMPARSGIGGLDVQFGAIQTEDASREAACTVAPWIAGRRYCARAGEPGPRFTALYAGVQSELIAQLKGSGERGDFRVYMGGGMAHLQGMNFPSAFLPYVSAEALLDSSAAWSARAALYLCPSAPGGIAIAAPSVKVEYRF